jgi:hypothetical protein
MVAMVLILSFAASRNSGGSFLSAAPRAERDGQLESRGEALGSGLADESETEFWLCLVVWANALG